MEVLHVFARTVKRGKPDCITRAHNLMVSNGVQN